LEGFRPITAIVGRDKSHVRVSQYRYLPHGEKSASLKTPVGIFMGVYRKERFYSRSLVKTKVNGGGQVIPLYTIRCGKGHAHF
jgi:hypothetical protein